jgi:hypothetical protein
MALIQHSELTFDFVNKYLCKGKTKKDLWEDSDSKLSYWCFNRQLKRLEESDGKKFTYGKSNKSFSRDDIFNILDLKERGYGITATAKKYNRSYGCIESIFIGKTYKAYYHEYQKEKMLKSKNKPKKLCQRCGMPVPAHLHLFCEQCRIDNYRNKKEDSNSSLP